MEPAKWFVTWSSLCLRECAESVYFEEIACYTIICLTAVLCYEMCHVRFCGILTHSHVDVSFQWSRVDSSKRPGMAARTAAVHWLAPSSRSLATTASFWVVQRGGHALRRARGTAWRRRVSVSPFTLTARVVVILNV